MKKLITLSVLAAAASVASAETKVEVFGFLDQGLTFIHENSNKVPATYRHGASKPEKNSIPIGPCLFT